IEQLSKDWTSPIYVFFRTLPRIDYVDGRQAHIFECAAGRCRDKNGRDVRRYLDKADAKSTSGLRWHATKCWGAEAVKSADGTKDLEAARAILLKTKLRDGTITAEFERIGRGKVTYSHRQHTSTEASLMKTGRPAYHIPSAETVSRDVWNVFVNVRKRVAKILQEHKGALNFATDAWTSPNHKAYVVVTVHFKDEGVPMAMLLDIVELACSHSGFNLAAAF
ncbi:hypothetical protein BYT27DRAFT_7012694, partial [Phlegmacium glaucopus]